MFSSQVTRLLARRGSFTLALTLVFLMFTCPLPMISVLIRSRTRYLVSSGLSPLRTMSSSLSLFPSKRRGLNLACGFKDGSVGQGDVLGLFLYHLAFDPSCRDPAEGTRLRLGFSSNTKRARPATPTTTTMT